MTPAERDARFMARALALAERGLGRTYPNPPVGAVLVRGMRVVGEGFHARAGAPHAEILALRQAGAAAHGAELFLTLEPCTHHGRTPPCVDALVPLGLKRVVVATTDPNPRVRGRGIRRLRAAGIEVVVGPGGAEARELLAGFRSLMLGGRPLFTLKLAMTLDGRIATRGGDARWITGPVARRLAHRLRDRHDAVLVGAGTIRADDPRLTCRLPGGRHPVRVVVVGPDVNLSPTARVFRTRTAPTWVVTPRSAAPRRVARLRRRGVEIVAVPADRHGRVSFRRAARALGRRGLTSVLIEGGALVAAQALRAGVVDRLVLFVAPRLLGGDALPAIGPLHVARIAGALRLHKIRVAPAGDDLVISAQVVRSRFASTRAAR